MALNPYESPREAASFCPPRRQPTANQLLAIFCLWFVAISSSVVLSAFFTWLSGRPLK
jgi:hypothetical protein